MLVARTTATGAHVVLPVAGLLVGLGARLAARARGGPVQAASVLGVLAAVVVGELLLFRAALQPRLVAMHRAEGAADADVRAQDELGRMGMGEYLHIELGAGFLLGVTAALIVAWLVTRAPTAVVAFRAPWTGDGPPSQRDPEADDAATSSPAEPQSPA